MNMIDKDKTDMMVVGAGPGGLTAAIRLVEAGFRVLVADPRVPFEKPCGGGLTPRILDYLPVQPVHWTETRAVYVVNFSWGNGKVRVVELDEPLLCTSRKKLGEALLQRYKQSGGMFLSHAVVSVTREPTGWLLKLDNGQRVSASFVIFADGVYGISRKVMGHFRDPRNWTRTFGGEARSPLTEIFIRFDSDLKGYGWIFPRGTTVSVGVCDDLRAYRGSLKEWLTVWLESFSIKPDTTYGYLIPSWRILKDTYPRMGRDWVRIGDSAGLVDPITREGIYPAVLMGWRVAEALIHDRYPDHYRSWLMREMYPEWRSMARWRKLFFHPIFQWGFYQTLRSRKGQRLVARLLTGRISYRDLLRQLVRISGG